MPSEESGYVDCGVTFCRGIPRAESGFGDVELYVFSGFFIGKLREVPLKLRMVREGLATDLVCK